MMVEMIHINIPKNAKLVPKTNQMILAQNCYSSRDGRETRLNNNVVVIGSSGAGKSRGVVMPNILQANTNYVISDPKGTLSKKYTSYLEGQGYCVKVLDFIHPLKSVHYNPLAYCHTTTDMQALANMIVSELDEVDKGRRSGGDPYWNDSATSLIASLIAYVKETDEIPKEKKNISQLAALLRLAKKSNDPRVRNLDRLMEEHNEKMQRKNKESWAYQCYQQFGNVPEKTYSCVVSTAAVKLGTFDTKELREMMRYNELDLTSLGCKKTAIFVVVSDTDRSLDMLANLFYSQMMNALCRFADEQPEGRLPMEVQFLLDDFATNARIDNFDNIISNIRSRGISAMIMLQSEAQLKAKYGENAKTIIDNCDTYIYMGCMDPDNAKSVSYRVNKSVNTVLSLELGKCYVCRRGAKAELCDIIDLEWLEKIREREDDSFFAVF